MEPLGINQDSKAKSILLDEFINGKKLDAKGAVQRSSKDESILEEIKKKLKENYSWDGNTSLAEMAGQNCSDMLVRVGEISFITLKFTLRESHLFVFYSISVSFQNSFEQPYYHLCELLPTYFIIKFTFGFQRNIYY